MKTINKVISLAVISTMAFSMSSCSLMGGSGNTDDVVTAAEDFSKALKSRKASKIAKLCDDQDADEIANYLMGSEEFASIIDYVADTVEYKIDEDSAEIKKDKATVDVTFTMVDYKAVSETDTIFNSNDDAIETLKKAGEIDVDTTIEFAKDDDQWLVTNLDDVLDDVYAFCKMKLVVATSPNATEATEQTDGTTEPVATEPSEPSTPANPDEPTIDDPDETSPEDNIYWVDDGVFAAWVDNNWCKANVVERTSDNKFAYGWYSADPKQVKQDGTFSSNEKICYVIPLNEKADTSKEIYFTLIYVGTSKDSTGDVKVLESVPVKATQVDGAPYFLYEAKVPSEPGYYEIVVSEDKLMEHQILLATGVVK